MLATAGAWAVWDSQAHLGAAQRSRSADGPGHVPDAAYAAATPAALIASSKALRVGSTVRTGDGFVYKVAHETAADFHVATAGGAKLYVVPSPNFDVRAFGADPSGIKASQTEIQKAIDAIAADAIASGVNTGTYTIVMPKGRYRLDSGLRLPPWIKLGATDPVVFDFSNAPGDVVAFRIDNERGPASSPGRGAANTGAVLNGPFHIDGPGMAATESVGLDIGNITPGLSSDRASRDIQLNNVVVTNFGTLLKLRDRDTYLFSATNCRFELAGVRVLDCPYAAKSNSGERMTFVNCTFAGAPQGIRVSTLQELVFIGCSFDFLKSSTLYLNSNASYFHIKFIGCHFEGSSNDALVEYDFASSHGFTLQMSDCQINAKTDATAPADARPDGIACPRRPLFTGPFDAVISGLHVLYGRSTHTAAGLFLFDDDVSLASGLSGLTFATNASANPTELRQAVHASLIPNYNWNFNEATDGQALTFSATQIAGWTLRSLSSALTATVTDDIAFGASGKSLELVASGASQFIEMFSDPFPVAQGDDVFNQAVIHGGTSTGDLNTTWTLAQYRPVPVKSHSVSAQSASGGNCTLTIGSHGIKVGDVVTVTGSDAAYTGPRVVTAVAATTITYSVASGSTSPPASMTVTTDGLSLVSRTTSYGHYFATSYNDTDDPAYTGDRDHWAKMSAYNLIPRSAAKILPGVSHARLTISIARINSGDTFHLGAALGQRLRCRVGDAMPNPIHLSACPPAFRR